MSAVDSIEELFAEQRFLGGIYAGHSQQYQFRGGDISLQRRWGVNFRKSGIFGSGKRLLVSFEGESGRSTFFPSPQAREGGFEMEVREYLESRDQVLFQARRLPRSSFIDSLRGPCIEGVLYHVSKF